MPMIEIVIIGRGGQGAVTSAQVLAVAAFNAGKHSQSFPNFGIERMGAPVKSYCRIDEKPVYTHEQVYNADYALVLDHTLSRNLSEKVSKLVIVNSNKTPEEMCIKTGAKIVCVDITSIALKIMGKPFVNIAALGAFSALTGEVPLASLEEAIKLQMGPRGTAAEKNIAATKEAYETAKKMGRKGK